jgi:hypothetical protein
MLPDLRIATALLVTDARGVRVVAASPEFDTAEAERIAVLFGYPPPGVACPLAHFACPFGKHRVAVVRVEDRPGGLLGFRFLVLRTELYRHLGDPFAISDRYPPDWFATGPLPELAWPPQPLPERTLEQLDAILRHGDGPLLLGCTQAVVDGQRVRLERDEPAEALIRSLWQLLPDRSRAERWPATFAFSDELGFHLAAVPRSQGLLAGRESSIPIPTVSTLVTGPTVPATSAASTRPPPLTEEAVRDYPPSSYELNLQIAVESGDRAALRRLLARRTTDETLRLGLYMLAFAVVAAVVSRFVL